MAEIDEIKVKNNIDKYFNITLRDALKYNEIFDINVNLNNSRIQLVSNVGSQLIQRLINNKKNIINLEQSLLKGLQKIDPELSNVNIYVYPPNRILITLSFNKHLIDINEIGVYANIASELDNQGIQGLCRSSPVFADACNNNAFWHELFKRKYYKYYLGDTAAKSKDYNWKEVFLGMQDFVNVFDHKQVVKSGVLGNLAYEGDLISYEYFSGIVTKYPHTLKYLLDENILKLTNSMAYAIIVNLDYDNDGLNILETIMKTQPEAVQNRFSLLGDLKSKDLVKVDNLLMKYGKSLVDLEDPNSFGSVSYYLNHLIDYDTKGDVNLYIFLTDKLKRPKDINMYLKDYINVFSGNNKLYNYILTQLPEILDKNQIMDTLDSLIIDGDRGDKILAFYNKYRRLLSPEDKKELIEKVEEDYDNPNQQSYEYVINIFRN